MDVKIPLPKFLTLFTTQNVNIQKAMALSAKIYKDYNIPAKIAELSDMKLIALGIANKEDRTTVMKAMRESGYMPKDVRKKRLEDDSSSIAAGTSTPPTFAKSIVTSSSKGKRKRTDNANTMLPTGPIDEEVTTYESFDFGEVLDEKVLKLNSTIVNRAPIMTVWATIVAERMGFQREEALSIASVYTEMNAVTKGVSLGIHKPGEEQGMEAVKGGSQSYVELMGRRPLYRTQTEQWRALSRGSPVGPHTAFRYISRALRQTLPHVTGALKLLAESFTVQELNSIAWSLYAEFRPSTTEWGKRSEVKCSTILGLRGDRVSQRSVDVDTDMGNEDLATIEINQASPRKRMRSLEEERAEKGRLLNDADSGLEITK